jgi:ADP-heptose:LPS heptosyltransferase
MSHIAEVYAKDLGVKISRPVIADHFFPGLPDKYITFQASNKMPAKDYKYWDLVISLIKPYIGDIKIIQVGGPKDPQTKGIDVFAPSSYRQMNYIIKNGQAHFGVDSLPMHVASVYDKPIVGLFSNLYKENAVPLWNKETKAICLEPDFSECKPSFGANCQRINEIKPETIAQAILDQLGIKEKIKFKTIRIGSHFNNEVVEVIPNFFGYSKELAGKPVNIRGDLHFNLNNICQWSQMCMASLHLSEIFNTEDLQYMPNLKQVIYEYDEHEETDLSEFFKILKNRKIQVVIRVKDKNKISDVRLKYFDFNVIEDNEPREEIKAAKFISKKRFVSNAEVFKSESSAKRLDKSNNFVYDETSSKELESLYLYDEE